MAKLIDDVLREIYEAGYKNGRADAMREMKSTLKLIGGVIDGVLDDEIKELSENRN